MAPQTPERELLIQFFLERRALPLRQAAKLVGWSPSALLRHACSEGALLPGERVVWSEVALLLLHAWPRARLLEMLGAHAASLPEGLHLTRVRWRLPLYLVQALERQADANARPIEDYVADVLDLAIDDEVVAALEKNRAFREAYEFPDDDENERSASHGYR